MDDIIVIILTLIFIVASIFGQRKKRPPVPESETEKPSAGDNFWDMLNEEWKEATQPEPPAQQKPVEKPVQMNMKKTPYSFEAQKEGTRTITREPEQPKEATRKFIKKKFSLKEAVIYSEILNTKYI